MDAAVREVFEETGYDIRILIQENNFLEAFIHDSVARLYIIPGIPEDTHFEARTRNEIKVCEFCCLLLFFIKKGKLMY